MPGLCLSSILETDEEGKRERTNPLPSRYRKQLEEWQKSKGKTYKRPPMKFKAKRKVIEEMNISFWKSMEREAEEEEEKKARLELSSKINSTLTECLRLIEEVSERPELQNSGLQSALVLKGFLTERRNSLHLSRNPAALQIQKNSDRSGSNAGEMHFRGSSEMLGNTGTI